MGKFVNKMIFVVLVPFVHVGCNAAENSNSAPVQNTQSEQKSTVGTNSKSKKSIHKSPAKGGNDTCGKICDVSERLSCKQPRSACMDACNEMASIVICKAEMVGVMECVTKEPDAHWRCSEESIASIRTGYCENEQARFVACMSRENM